MNLVQALPRPLLPLRAHGDALTHHSLPLGTCHGAEQHLVLGAEGTTSLVPSAHPAPLRQCWSHPTVLGSCRGPARLTAAPGCALGLPCRAADTEKYQLPALTSEHAGLCTTQQKEAAKAQAL